MRIHRITVALNHASFVRLLISFASISATVYKPYLFFFGRTKILSVLLMRQLRKGRNTAEAVLVGLNDTFENIKNINQDKIR